MEPTLATAARLMATQHGLAHRAQLRAIGLADTRVAARLASGSWVEVAPDVVGAGGAPASDLRRVWHAVLATGIRADGTERPVAVGSLAAAALLACDVAMPHAVEVVVARGLSCPRPSGVVIRAVSDWEERRFVRHGGLLVTALPDTLVDCAAHLADEQFLTLLQAQCYARPHLLGRVLARCHRGSKGSARARRVGAELARGFDSPLHARAVAALRRAGLAPDACHVEVVDGAGPSDCVYVRGGAAVVAVEVDGDVHRLSRQAFLHDRAKDLALRAAGCGTLRFTVEQVDAVTPMVAAIRAALAPYELAVAARTPGVA